MPARSKQYVQEPTGRGGGSDVELSTFYRFSYCTVNWLLIYSEGKVLRMAQHFNNSGV